MKDADPTPAGHGDVGKFGFIENVNRRSGGTLRTEVPGWPIIGLRLLSRRCGAFRRAGQSGLARVIPLGMVTRPPGAGGIGPRQGAGSAAEPCKTVHGGT
ncbi:MAG: hypothetical protein HKM86_10655 [Deltaproteobacteria bacterium]|nr:hypothetical protein [Deltaproteobacteria bacterium]